LNRRLGFIAVDQPQPVSLDWHTILIGALIALTALELIDLVTGKPAPSPKRRKRGGRN